VGQVCLHFLHADFRFSLVAQIPDIAGEKSVFPELCFADLEVNRNDMTIGELRLHHAANTDDAFLARVHVVLHVPVMPFQVVVGHEHADILAHSFGERITKNGFRRLAHGENRPRFVDHDHGIRHRGQNRFQQAFQGQNPRVSYDRADRRI